jgi:hypothetical protein
MEALAEVPAADRIVKSTDNAPPDPFVAHKVNIESLYEEAKNWADGKVIETQAQADEVERLLDMIDAAYAAAEASRVAAKKPLDDEIAKIQTAYNPLIGNTTKITGIAVKAKTALLGVQTVWKNKLQAERDAEAARLRKIADDAAEAARKAAATVDHTDLAAAEEAEAVIQQAAVASRQATQAASNTVKGMRTVWETVIADKKQATLAMLTRHPDQCLAFFLDLAKADVREGKREIPGFTITSSKVAV